MKKTGSRGTGRGTARIRLRLSASLSDYRFPDCRQEPPDKIRRDLGGPGAVPFKIAMAVPIGGIRDGPDRNEGDPVHIAHMGRRLPFPYPPPGRRSIDECVPGPDFQQRTRPWRLFQIKWGALPFPRIFSRRKAAPRPMENKPMAATDESLSAHPPPHHDKPTAPRPPYRTA